MLGVTLYISDAVVDEVVEVLCPDPLEESTPQQAKKNLIQYIKNRVAANRKKLVGEAVDVSDLEIT